MDLKDLSYILYMESRDLKDKDYNSLTEYEKVNLELNPFVEIHTPTTAEISENNTANPKNISPPVQKY